MPILDTGFVIAKRIKYRQPIYRADRWHFHHRMANIGFSQRRTLAYLYGWTLVMAGLALALRFVPYSDDHGNFDPLLDGGDASPASSPRSPPASTSWSRSRSSSCGDARCASCSAPRGSAPAEAEVDEGVARELETGSFPAVDPETGEFEAIDPETGESAEAP